MPALDEIDRPEKPMKAASRHGHDVGDQFFNPAALRSGVVAVRPSSLSQT
jgi:hypothetical protein